MNSPLKDKQLVLFNTEISSDAFFLATRYSLSMLNQHHLIYFIWAWVVLDPLQTKAALTLVS